MTGTDLPLSGSLTVGYVTLIAFWDRAGFLDLSSTMSGNCCLARFALLVLPDEKAVVTKEAQWFGNYLINRFIKKNCLDINLIFSKLRKPSLMFQNNFCLKLWVIDNIL